MDAEAIGDLIAAYHLPNVVMAAIGGILVDWIGGELASVLFATLVVVGTAITSSAHTLQIMLLGRLILGLGGESLVVAQLSILTHSFPAVSGIATSFPSQGVALALQLMVTRSATLLTFLFLPAAYDPEQLSRAAEGAEAASAGGRSVKAPLSAFEAGPGTVLVALSISSLVFAIVLLSMHVSLGFMTPSKVDCASILSCTCSELDDQDEVDGDPLPAGDRDNDTDSQTSTIESSKVRGVSNRNRSGCSPFQKWS